MIGKRVRGKTSSLRFFLTGARNIRALETMPMALFLPLLYFVFFLGGLPFNELIFPSPQKAKLNFWHQVMFIFIYAVICVFGYLMALTFVDRALRTSLTLANKISSVAKASTTITVSLTAVVLLPSHFSLANGIVKTTPHLLIGAVGLAILPAAYFAALIAAVTSYRVIFSTIPSHATEMVFALSMGIATLAAAGVILDLIAATLVTLIFLAFLTLAILALFIWGLKVLLTGKRS